MYIIRVNKRRIEGIIDSAGNTFLSGIVFKILHDPLMKICRYIKFKRRKLAPSNIKDVTVTGGEFVTIIPCDTVAYRKLLKELGIRQKENPIS